METNSTEKKEAAARAEMHNAYPVGIAFGSHCLAVCRRVVAEQGGEPWMALWMAAIAAHESGWGHYSIGTYNVIGYQWIDGCAWSNDYAWAIEKASGRGIRYRKFGSLKECFAALYYLIAKSKNYASSRGDYERAVAEADAMAAHGFSSGTVAGRRAAAQTDFILSFSLEYSADPKHGEAVLTLMKEIENHAI